MKKLIFFRHAESETNIGGISKPNAEIEITAKGKQQAQTLAEQFNLTPKHIFTSSFLRTQQTAEPLAKKLQLTPTALDCLNEFNTFDYQLIKGLTGAQRLPLTLGYWRAADPDLRNGEHSQSLNEFNQQVLSAINIVRELPEESVIFGHGMWFSLFAWHALGLAPLCFEQTHMQAYFKFHRVFPVTNTAGFEILVDEKSTAIYVRKLNF